jgi:hypothetical protein
MDDEEKNGVPAKVEWDSLAETKNQAVDVEKLDLDQLGIPAAKQDIVRAKLGEFVSLWEREIDKHVASGGADGSSPFNLPPLLEKRRLEWKIPDGVFRVSPGTLYDRILIYQIPMLSECREDANKIGGAAGILWKSEQTKEKETREAPRGIIVGAGLKALDSLRSHGVDLGHIVCFCKNTTYSIQVDYIAGKWDRVSLAREGDLVLSEDVALGMRTGAVHVEAYERTDEDGVKYTEHLLVDGKGIAHERMLPPAEDDL